MLSLRQSDYLAPLALCKSSGSPDQSEDLRKARSASEGGANVGGSCYEWPSMSGQATPGGGSNPPAEGSPAAQEPLPWYRSPHDQLYQYPAHMYQRFGQHFNFLPQYAGGGPTSYGLLPRPYPDLPLLNRHFLSVPTPIPAKRRSSPYPTPEVVTDKPASPKSPQSRSPTVPTYDVEPDPRNQSPYRVLPSGKEGSLKHRLLHPPPSINIVEPPPSLLGNAPLSAPPMRNRSEDAPPSPHWPNRAEGPRLAVSSMHPPGASTVVRSNAPTLHYPAYFMKGSIIQLGNGLLKKVEDLETEDFVSSANVSRDLRIDSSRVVKMAESPASGEAVAVLSFSVGQNQVQVTVEAPVEHPFFVFNRGWSSCNPERSLQRYRLRCHNLSVGDVCISLTHRAASKLRPANTLSRSPIKVTTVPESSSARSEEMAAVSSVAAKTDPMNPLSIGASTSGKARKRRWSAPDQVAGVTTQVGIPMPERTATT